MMARLKFKTCTKETMLWFIQQLSADPMMKRRIEKIIYLLSGLKGDIPEYGQLHDWVATIIGYDVVGKYDAFITAKYQYCCQHFNARKLKKKWFVNHTYFGWVPSLLMDEDYVFFPDRNHPGQYVKDEEFIYFAYKLTHLLINKKGYHTVSRSFFLNPSKPVYQEYYKKTGRRLTKAKLSHLNKVMTERKIVCCYQRPNKTNLYVIGSLNPYYQLGSIVSDDDITSIFTTYKVDVSTQFQEQCKGKHLIPGQREKHIRQSIKDVRYKFARQKAAQQEALRRENKCRQNDKNHNPVSIPGSSECLDLDEIIEQMKRSM